MMKWAFWRLVLASGGPICFFCCCCYCYCFVFVFFFVIWNRCSNETKTFQSVYMAALARGFSDRHFEQGEGPGDKVDYEF